MKQDRQGAAGFGGVKQGGHRADGYGGRRGDGRRAAALQEGW